MNKTIVKNGRKIIGFAYKNSMGEFYYAFGKPSASEYISFKCNSINDGVSKIQLYSNS
jgi:hypothetical protein